MELWDCAGRKWATKPWKRWCGWAIRSRLEPVRQVAKMMNDDLWGIVNVIVPRVTTAMRRVSTAGSEVGATVAGSGPVPRSISTPAGLVSTLRVLGDEPYPHDWGRPKMYIHSTMKRSNWRSCKRYPKSAHL